jgi:hypothetical protein
MYIDGGGDFSNVSMSLSTVNATCNTVGGTSHGLYSNAVLILSDCA